MSNIKFEPFDQIVLKNNIQCTVLDVVDKNHIIIHPKYVFDDNKVTRISNPVSSERSNSFCLENALIFGDKDYLINTEQVISHFPCVNKNQMVVLNHDKNSRKIVKAAKDLYDKIKEKVPNATVLFTGSLATGHAMDNYSDIDIVLNLSDFKCLKQTDFFLSDKIHMRDLYEWEKFYKDYDVKSLLSSSEFALLNLSNFRQFEYLKIPVSIFVVSNEIALSILKSFNINDMSKNQKVNIIGEIICENNSCLPGWFILKNENKAFLTFNFNRVFQGNLLQGRLYSMELINIGNTGLYMLNDDSYCKILR